MKNQVQKNQLSFWLLCKFKDQNTNFEFSKIDSELSFLSFSQSSQPHPLLPSTNKKTHLLLGWTKNIWRQMCKCGCTTTFKKCYVNVGAQPLSIKATKFTKWMWVYNNFKKLQNCKINVGVQDKAIHWL